MKITTTKSYVIELSEQQIRMLWDAIGNTSNTSRIDAGMTQEQSRLCVSCMP